MTLENVQVNGRLLVILVTIIGLVSVVGVIISAVAINRPSMPTVTISQTGGGPPGGGSDSLPSPSSSSSSSSSSGGKTLRSVDQPGVVVNNGFGGSSGYEKKVWTVAVGHDYGAHDYIDSQGTLRGFNMDVARHVCQAANIDCRIIYDKYSNCWNAQPGQHPSGGQGLLGGWYDACVGWAPTLDRIHVFDFSIGYVQPGNSYFYVKKGVATFTSGNLTGKKIGFVRGWASDERCLQRESTATGLPLAASSIVYVESPSELVNLLKTGQVDAIFTTEDAVVFYEDNHEISLIKDLSYACTNGNYGIMARKDSAFVNKWNQGFQKIRSDGLFKTLCKEAKTIHSAKGSFTCVYV